jgi:hypothetical protein
MYPPIENTLKLVPELLSRATPTGPAKIVPAIGF